MPRTIGASFSSQLSSQSIRPFYAVKLDYEQVLRIWTGHGEITISSEIYTGSSSLISISSIKETAEIKAGGISLTFSGIPTDILSPAFNQTKQGVEALIFFGVLTTTSNSQAIVNTPYQLFAGTIDTVSLAEDGGNSTVQITVENKLISLEKPLDFKYSDQDQKFFFPDDKGLEFVNDLQDKKIVWGG